MEFGMNENDSMTDGERTVMSERQPDNPYNIDFERERRLKRMFQILIGAGLGVAFLLLVIGYAMDALIASKTGDIAPVTPYSTPASADSPRNQTVAPQ